MIVELVAAEKERENAFLVGLRGFLVILALSLHAIFEGNLLFLFSFSLSPSLL